MRNKLLILAAIFMMGAGLSQAWAQTSAETAKKASDEAAQWASQAAASAAEGHKALQDLEAAITNLQATIKAQEAGEDKDLLKKSQAELKKLEELKASLTEKVEKMDVAAAQAQTAAQAAKEAADRASAEGVSEADAQAAAGQALRQAKLAKKAAQQAAGYLGGANQNVLQSGFGNLIRIKEPVSMPDTMSIVVPQPPPPVPGPGPTPTPAGRGRRGSSN
jgi:hypothetical protein